MFQDIEAQRAALAQLPEKRFIRTDPNVKGPYTSGDYVRWKLNQIFGPDNWCHTIINGPEIVHLNESQAYVQAVVRLDVQFANRNQVTHEDVGVWPLAATNAKQGGTLDDTDPARYETVLKACVTDAIKACAESLGVCFRPLADKTLEATLVAREVAAAGAATNGKSATPQAKAQAPSAPAATEPPKPAAATTNAATPASDAIPAAPVASASTRSTPSAPAPLVPAAAGKKQASLKCSLKEFDRLATNFAKRYPQYLTADGKADKSHVLYMLAACGFPSITDTNLEPAFEAAARHAPGQPIQPPAATQDGGVPF